jgi:hypothetical protein
VCWESVLKSIGASLRSQAPLPGRLKEGTARMDFTGFVRKPPSRALRGLGAAVLLFGVYCYWTAEDHNTLPAARIAKTDGQKVTDALQADVPTIVLVGKRTKIQAGQSQIVADLVLVNPLDVPVTYTGYRMDCFSTRPAAGEIHPFCSKEVIEPDTEDVREPIVFWCGTGAGTMSVPPKYAGRFAAGVALPVSSARVGIECSWVSADGRTQSQKIWSENFAAD